MRFTVRGADPATGIEVALPVEAATAADAEAQANAKGLYVTAVEAGADPPPAALPPPIPTGPGDLPPVVGRPRSDRRSWWSRPSMSRRRTAVAAGAVAVLVPLLTWWMSAKDRLFPAEPSAHRAHPAAADAGADAWGQMASAPARRSADDLRTLLSGTFASPAGGEIDLSITFAYPRYTLNPSRTHRWAAGNAGTWELVAEHPALTTAKRDEAWHLLTMTAPDDPAAPIPAHVRFDLDERGRVRALRFASFLGVRFPAGRQMVMTRTETPADSPMASSSASAAAAARLPAQPPPPLRPAEDGGKPGLGRAGYAVDRCLICGGGRSAAARTLYADRRGFGLCGECGRGYRAWERLLSSAQSGFPPASADRALVEDFKVALGASFDRADEPGRRGLGMFFLTGKFASPEWDALTGTD